MHTFDPLRLRLSALTAPQAPSSFSELLTTLDPNELISVWSGPDFASHCQPTLVGEGAAVALVASPAAPPQVVVDETLTTTVLANPSREDVLGMLSSRDHLPGDQVRQQPQFMRLSRRWQKLVEDASFVDEDGVTDSLEAGGLALPTAFISFGFGPHAPAVAILPRRTWIQFDGRWFVLEASVGDANVTVSEDVARPAPETTAGEDLGGKPAGTTVSPALPHSRGREAADDAHAVELTPGTMRRSQWRRAVAEVIAEIKGGHAQKVVMSRDLRVHSSARFEVSQLASSLAQNNPSCWVFAVAGLVGASPEMLASVRGNEVHSRVLAGTCRPGEGAQLLRSAKDREEHALAVSSVTGALESMTRRLDVDPEPFLLDLSHVSHLATDISGQLESWRGLCDVLAQLHPSAAVCGTPTQEAFEILAAFERTDRGRYTGPVGWMDARGGGACAIALRCGQVDTSAHNIRLFAGGGIMPNSDPDAELAETQAKMAAMLETLGVK